MSNFQRNQVFIHEYADLRTEVARTTILLIINASVHDRDDISGAIVHLGPSFVHLFRSSLHSIRKTLTWFR